MRAAARRVGVGQRAESRRRLRPAGDEANRLASTSPKVRGSATDLSSPVGPKVGAALGVHKLDVDPHTIAAALDASLQRPRTERALRPVGQQACGPNPSKHRIAQRRENAAGGRRALIRHDANHAGRFGETGPIDFAIRWNLGASGLFHSARKFEDMTEPRTCKNSKLAFDQPAPSRNCSALSLAERIEIDFTVPRQDHRVLKFACRRIAGARERQRARMFERKRASPAFGHDWTDDFLSFAGFQVAFRIPIKCNDDMIGHCPNWPGSAARTQTRSRTG